MITGIMYILHWWFLIFIIGLLALPLTRRFFRSFPDRGYLLTKGIGLIAILFFNWILCSLHLLPFSLGSIVAALIILGLLSFFFSSESMTETLLFFKRNQKHVLFTELTFLGCFLFFGIIRMCNPDIASTEKMPDFAFLTAILNSEYFPPKDTWFHGGTINYFYYGHYQIAFLTKLSGIAPEFAFNLGIAFLFAITFLNATAIANALTNRIGYGFMGGMFVALIGNLDGIFQTFTRLGGVIFGSDSLYPFQWFNWWMSSRVIVREGVDITINEFPFWSYILGDLHAHVNVVPFSLVVLAIALEVLRSSGDGFSVIGKGRDWPFRLFFISIALGAIPAANTWDLPTYYSIITLSLLFGRQFALQKSTSTFGGILLSPVTELISYFKKNPLKPKSSLKNYLMSLVAIGCMIALSFFLYSPYYAHFEAKGTEGPRLVDAIQRTLFDDFITIYGFFFFCMTSLLIALLIPKFQSCESRLKVLLLSGLGFVTLFSLIAFGTLMITLCVVLFILLLRVQIPFDEDDSRNKFFALSLFFIVLLILLGCEFIYLKDDYGKTLERQNTIFKFYYQAWIFCGLSSIFSVFWIRERIKERWVDVWESAFRILFVFTLAFPIIGTTVKCDHFAAFKSGNPYARVTMEGIYYMSWRFPGDYQAIQYLKKNGSPNDTVVEATGPAFSHYGRISAATGMSTLLGWANHENIWRRGAWNSISERVNDTKEIYMTSDLTKLQQILGKYSIRYVFCGGLEREQYPQANFSKFEGFMKKVVELTDADGKKTILYENIKNQPSRED